MRSLGNPCKRFLAGDGVSAPDFTVLPLRGVFEGISIDARAARKNLPALGEAFGIAKNLDEYQYKICSLVPSLADSNPAKQRLQKCRVLALAALGELVSLARQDNGRVPGWNASARAVLVEASDLYVAVTTTAAQGKAPPPLLLPKQAGNAAAQIRFGLDEKEVERALGSMYG